MSEQQGTTKAGAARASGATPAQAKEYARRARGSVPAPSPTSAPLLPKAGDVRARAFFFDLDGTLLQMDLRAFMDGYFSTIVAFANERGLDGEAFMKAVNAGVFALRENGSGQTNDQVFWSVFLAKMGKTRGFWEPFVEDYYRTRFNDVGKGVAQSPDAARMIATLKDKGYALVLATMPLFPRIAVEQRLGWAGIDPASFARITAYDNSRALKPSPVYWSENLGACGVAAQEVVMVGNNTVEDYGFTEVGATVVLATDCLLNPSDADMSTLPHGSLAQIAQWVDQLPVCENPVDTVREGPVDQAIARKMLAASRVPGRAAAPAPDSTEPEEE